ncbi:MAG: hypothetical protein JJU44_05990 [Planctomycetes bacterium]|nr:hypothetical protein [Planctomycetota bacterium]
MAVIAVVGVLITLAMPMLTKSRDRGHIARSLATHRQINLLVVAHCNDNAERYPFPYVRRTGSMAYPDYEASGTLGPGFERPRMALQARIWASLFRDRHPEIIRTVYQGRWTDLVGRDVPNGLIGGSFVATSTMFADPEFFALDPDRARERHLRPTKTTQLVFPSGKMLFEDLDSWQRLTEGLETIRTATLSFADGSAATMSLEEMTGDWVARSMAWQSAPGHTTLNGLAGRDR